MSEEKKAISITSQDCIGLRVPVDGIATSSLLDESLTRSSSSDIVGSSASPDVVELHLSFVAKKVSFI